MWTKRHGLCADMLIQIILCLPAVRSTILFDTRVSESQVCKHTRTNTPHQLYWYTQKHEHKCTNTTKFTSFLLHLCCYITTIIEITNTTSTFWLFCSTKDCHTEADCSCTCLEELDMFEHIRNAAQRVVTS